MLPFPKRQPVAARAAIAGLGLLSDRLRQKPLCLRTKEQPRGSQCSCTLCFCLRLSSACCVALLPSDDSRSASGNHPGSNERTGPSCNLPLLIGQARPLRHECLMRNFGSLVMALGSGLRAEGFLRPNGEVYIAVKRARRSSSLIDGESVACCGYTTSAAKQHKGRGFKVRSRSTLNPRHA
jgi:hypothetical protein